MTGASWRSATSRARDARRSTAPAWCVTPGFVDPHTHYDAQLFWDPSASPSNVHGVTTVIGGNCGFTLAPLHAEDADYLRRMMAQVEGMPLAALEQGVAWDWETLRRVPEPARRRHRRQRRVPRRSLRDPPLRDGRGGRRPRGDRRRGRGDGGRARDRDRGRRARLLHHAVEHPLRRRREAGRVALGEPRRGARALCARSSDHEGTTLEAIIDGCLDQFSDEEIDLFARMSVAGQRPLNWNVLTVDSRVPERVTRQL